jgi:hypothetical protein
MHKAAFGAAFFRCGAAKSDTLAGIGGTMLPSGTLVRNWSRSRVVFGEDPESTLDDSYLPANTA